MPLNELDRPTVLAAIQKLYDIEVEVRKQLDDMHTQLINLLNDLRD